MRVFLSILALVTVQASADPLNIDPKFVFRLFKIEQNHVTVSLDSAVFGQIDLAGDIVDPSAAVQTAQLVLDKQNADQGGTNHIQANIELHAGASTGVFYVSMSVVSSQGQIGDLFLLKGPDYAPLTQAPIAGSGGQIDTILAQIPKLMEQKNAKRTGAELIQKLAEYANKHPTVQLDGYIPLIENDDKELLSVVQPNQPQRPVQIDPAVDPLDPGVAPTDPVVDPGPSVPYENPAVDPYNPNDTLDSLGQPQNLGDPNYGQVQIPPPQYNQSPFQNNGGGPYNGDNGSVYHQDFNNDMHPFSTGSF